MKKPVIGIIGRVKNDHKSNIMVYDEYRLAIINSGGIPILLLPPYNKNIDSLKPFENNLNKEDKDIVFTIIEKCDGFLFPGGDKWYGFEQYIYKYAFINDKPVLGICLGMQFLSSLNIFEDCTNLIVSNINHNQKSIYVHEVNIVDSKLKSILKASSIWTNSRHSYTIHKGIKYIISSYAIDGVIESIEIPNKKFIIGVQWHPESNYDKDIYSKRLFDAFINNCII